MAIVYINLSKIGAKTVGGKQPTVVTRGAGQAGAVTVAYDTTLISTKNELLQAVQDILVTAGDLLK